MQRNSPEESEKALLEILSSEEARHRYVTSIRRVLEDERAERRGQAANPFGTGRKGLRAIANRTLD